jgi:glycosyltransferase involved in cell wall biosynthesis
MIKVCHLTSVHHWNDIRIFLKECVSLAAQNFDVTLIAYDAPDERIENVRIVNAGIRPLNRKDRIRKSKKLFEKIAVGQDAEIYHFHDPELIPLGKKLARKGKTVVYDIHEDVPRQLLDKPYLNPLLARVLAFVFERYENSAVKYFSALSCATPHIRKRFEKHHPLVYDINNFPLLPESPETSSSQVAKENQVCYVGGISKIRGILPLIDAMEFCNGITLVLAGEFPDGALKEKAKASPGWKYVNELGLIDRKTAQKVMCESIAGMITFLPAANHIHAQPNKIFEYMSAGIPVIASDFPLWKEVIESCNCGLTVDPFSPASIAHAICDLVQNKERAELMGENGQNAVLNQYNWQTEEKKLMELYSRIQNIRKK